MDIVLIAARAANGVIGKAGGLVFTLPGDLPRFKRLTMGKPVIMGRKTWESLPLRPLPGRRNIVLTHQPGWAAEGAEVAASVDDALALAAGAAEVCVIGGAEVYALFLPLATRLELTEVRAEAEGDVVFPSYSGLEWRETLRVENPGAPAFDYVTYQRR